VADDDRFAPIYRALQEPPRIFGLPVLVSVGLLGSVLVLFMGAMFWSWKAGLAVIAGGLCAWTAAWWVCSFDRTKLPRMLVGLTYRVPSRLTSLRPGTARTTFRDVGGEGSVERSDQLSAAAGGSQRGGER
jgi:hypothetical protein